MQILNIGSINIDHVYAVEHFVRPGETVASRRYTIFAGGKGFNQSVALARAGARTRQAGRIGKDAGWLLERLAREGVDTSCLRVTDTATGHAIIQVTPSGENAIVLHGGANQDVSEADIDQAISSCAPGDYLLLQNEISSVNHALERGHERRLRVVFNPAPITPAVRNYPLERVDLFILNETEAEGLMGPHDPDGILDEMRRRFPRAAVVLTLGARGAMYGDAQTHIRQAAIPVKAVDTTGAGDTFIGYFLAELMRRHDPAAALAMGCRAAAICVTRSGASDSIPGRDEVGEGGG